jgi:AbrB family looped-hinge helix DNA binding protein
MAFGDNNGMTLKIDKAGRIVVPKSVRERFGLRAGSELELSENEGQLLLKPVGQRPSLVLRGELLVHLGQPPDGYDWNGLVDADRHERMRHVGGW